VCIPNRSSKSPKRKREQKKRWFRNGQKWRTGCEGRISVVKRRNGLDRCRYKADDGMQRWVGLWRDLRQSHQHRTGNGQKSCPIVLAIIVALFTARRPPRRVLLCSTPLTKGSKASIFAPGSRLRQVDQKIH
jgi:hypothetical protein